MSRFGIFESSEGFVCLGSHDATHARLDEDQITIWKWDEVDGVMQMIPFEAYPWESVVGLDVDATSRQCRLSRPILFPIMVLLEFFGLAASMPSSDLALCIRLNNGGEVRRKCVGFLGWGYWWADLEASRQLLRELASGELKRNLLSDPLGFLELVRTRSRYLARPDDF